jgi:AraC-like DNA-binding protein
MSYTLLSVVLIRMMGGYYVVDANNSKEVSLAPAYISTLFSEGTKEAFTEYVTRLRLERALLIRKV